MMWRRNFALSNASKYYSAKLGPTYLGPFEVVEKRGSSGYMLKSREGNVDGLWNLKDLKLDSG